jgi:hypothetical protein
MKANGSTAMKHAAERKGKLDIKLTDSSKGEETNRRIPRTTIAELTT